MSSRSAKFRLFPLLLAGLAALLAVGIIVGVGYVWMGYRLDQDPAEIADAPHHGQPNVTFPIKDYRQPNLPRATRPLIGVNYTHHAFPNCDRRGTGILRTLHEPQVALKVHDQLLAMRRNGISSLRTIVWHITDASQLNAPLVSSAGGSLHEPSRTNLVRYLTEMRKFGFERLTIALSPEGRNGPQYRKYDPAKFAENWAFLKEIRSLTKRYGPADTRIDILNEGAPSDGTPPDVRGQLASYVSRMYRRYTRAFGARDVTVSTIGRRTPKDGNGTRLRNLITVLRSAGLPQPRWYDVHIGYNARKATRGLRSTYNVLRRNQRRQPLVIGETAYGKRSVARAIRAFVDRTGMRIDEITPWYIEREKACSISPPYDAEPYRAVFAKRSQG